VDGDDVVAGLEQRFPQFQEVADRRLGGRGQFRVGGQPPVEAVEAVHVQLALALALPAHVETGLADALGVGQAAG
jgi:hypothetical protein